VSSGAARVGPESLEGGQQRRDPVGADGPLDATAIPDALRLLLPTNISVTEPSADENRYAFRWKLVAGSWNARVATASWRTSASRVAEPRRQRP